MVNFGALVAGDSADKDNIKTQFDSGDAAFYFKFFDDDITAKQLATRLSVKTYNTSSQVMIYANASNGIWGTNKYGTDAEAFTTSVARVVSPENTFIELFLDSAFKSSTSPGVTWADDGEIVFT